MPFNGLASNKSLTLKNSAITQISSSFLIPSLGSPNTDQYALDTNQVISVTAVVCLIR